MIIIVHKFIVTQHRLWRTNLIKFKDIHCRRYTPKQRNYQPGTIVAVSAFEEKLKKICRLNVYRLNRSHRRILSAHQYWQTCLNFCTQMCFLIFAAYFQRQCGVDLNIDFGWVCLPYKHIGIFTGRIMVSLGFRHLGSIHAIDFLNIIGNLLETYFWLLRCNATPISK